MAKIQARNVEEALYQRIEASAMKHERSLEGEIRIALREYYAPAATETTPLSLRERWQQETGQRLKWLLSQLIADGYIDKWQRDRPAGITCFVRVAGQLDASPGLLMDVAEGRREMASGMAGTLAKQYGTSSDWLLTGEGAPFPVPDISHSYFTFFQPDNDADNYAFELIRICSGRHEGTLLCLRTNTGTNCSELAYFSAFLLGGKMGSTGYGRLEAFLLFLKTTGCRLAINIYDFTPPEPDFDFWSVMGQHHPVWFQEANQRATARWLQQMFIGDDPGEWFIGWGGVLETVRNASPTPENETP